MSALNQALCVNAVMDLGTNYADCLRTMNAAVLRGVTFELDSHLEQVVRLQPESLELLIGMVQDYNRQECLERCAHNREKGVKYGRPKIELPDNFFTEVQRWMAGEVSSSKAARNCGLSPSTFRLRAKKAGLTGPKTTPSERACPYTTEELPGVSSLRHRRSGTSSVPREGRKPPLPVKP